MLQLVDGDLEQEVEHQQARGGPGTHAGEYVPGAADQLLFERSPSLDGTTLLRCERGLIRQFDMSLSDFLSLSPFHCVHVKYVDSFVKAIRSHRSVICVLKFSKVTWNAKFELLCKLNQAMLTQ